MGNILFLESTAQVAKPGMAAVSKTAGRKAPQVQILPWALLRRVEYGFSRVRLNLNPDPRLPRFAQGAEAALALHRATVLEDGFQLRVARGVYHGLGGGPLTVAAGDKGVDALLYERTPADLQPPQLEA